MRNLLWMVAAVACGCGGSSTPAGEPFVSGSVDASFEGTAFSPTYGFATTYMGEGVIGFADSAVHCGTEKSPTPPSGHGVIIQVPGLVPGSYPNADVQIFQDVGGYKAEGSTGGLTISAVNTTVTGTITFSFTDPQTSQVFSANGSFEVIHCM